MNQQERLLKELAETLNSFERIKASAYKLYSETVEAITSDKITGEKQIERIMDGLLDFCDDDRFVDIYRKLCRHVYCRYPQMVGEHIALFRLQFETTDVVESEQQAPIDIQEVQSEE